jgi:DNA-binding transcriptional regulator YiaG
MTIKSLRLSCGMTQQAFSDYFGIPKRTIENWEGDKRKCPAYVFELMRYKLEKENLINTKAEE